MKQPEALKTAQVTIDKPPEIIVLPSPEPIKTKDVEWVVLTPDRLPKGDSWVYYGITPEQYENLSENMAEIFRWVKEAKFRLDYYRKEAAKNGRSTDAKDGGGSNSN